MKKTSITALIMLIFTSFGFAQTTIPNPKTGLSTASNIQITRIELSDTATILSFDVKYTPKNWKNIPLNTFIQRVNSNEKYFVKYSEGIPLNKNFFMPESGKTSYRLFFSALPKGTETIDFGEANDGGTRFIYDIALKATNTKLILPKELYANWFSAATGDLELSIHNKYVVYKSQLWSYGQYTVGKDINTLKLTTSNGNSQIIYFKADKAGTYLFGETTTDLKQYSNNSAEVLKTATIDNTLYELPIFKLDTATYSGYIKDYTPRTGMKTLSLSVDDIITGEQSSHLIKIDEKGYFTVKIPLYYPHSCYLRSSMLNGTVYLEPGKTVLQVFDNSNRKNPALFMGESAKINTDLDKLMNIRSFDYDKMRKTIVDMSAVQYKSFCKEAEINDLNALDSISKSTKISAKAIQIMKLGFAYQSMSNMMSYDMNFESTYREKNKIPRTQRKLDIKIDSLTAEYFDFIRPEIVNNQLAVIAPGYDSFINRLKFLEILRPTKQFSMNTQLIGDELAKSGYQFTKHEKELLEKMKQVDSISNSTERKEFIDKYGKQVNVFYTKYNEAFTKINTSSPNAYSETIDKYFKDNKIKLTADEKEVWGILSKFYNTPESKMAKDFYATSKDSISAFHKKHNEFTNECLAKKGNETRNEKLKSLFNIEAGFATDIMLAQDLSRKIVEEVSPVSAAKLQAIQHQFVSTFIAEYIAVCNNNAIAKLEANKKKTGFTINETPKTEADKIFDAIMQKFRGKVVYVDFWATWCGPCRSGMAQIKPLKEEMDSSKVAFVYITNQTSPLTTWNNMIPDIKGEHYRVSQDEWNYLSSKFNITGIPHYVLVGKDGTVINPQLKFMDNNGIKAIIEKYIKE
jgi:thiol-disulfide isomerase/thioredoxin